MEMTRIEKVQYVQKAIREGFKPYFGVSEKQVTVLSDTNLDIEIDIARNWMGDE